MRAHAVGLALALALGFAACTSDDDVDPVGASAAASSGSGASSAGGSGTGASSGAGASSGVQAGGAGPGGSAASGGDGGAGGSGGAPGEDLDGDGLDDADEATLAATYLPFLSLDPEDECPLGGIVYRLYPHPDDATKLHIVYDHLFQNDCGLGGHVGDNEVFAITVDPALPPPEGILAMRAASHQGTVCEVVSSCGTCDDLDPCDTADAGGKAVPVVYTSKDKHATYVRAGACAVTLCFDSCTLAETATVPPMVNAGEPGMPLTNDLTAAALITEANGWTEMELFAFDPWAPDVEFGGAGAVADDLVDPAFLTPVCP